MRRFPAILTQRQLTRSLGMLLLLLTPWSAVQAELDIGVLAFRGKEAALARWSPTADYLNSTIAGERFRIRPLDLDEMSAAVAAGELDFVLTNTGNYVVLEANHGVSRLATLKIQYADRELTRFGAVIFTRRDNEAIREIADLAGKSFMAVSREAFGGFQMAWREMLDQGVDPFDDLASVRFNGFPQDAIVHAVLSGEVDAGTVRAGTLDRMAAEGLVDLADVLVINRLDTTGFPFPHSTRLYPEWPFAKTRGTPESLAQDVAIALLSMPPDSAAAVAAGAGWTIPLDYGSVHELFRRLEIGPYADLSRPALDRVWREYRGWILTGVGALLLLGVVVVLTGRSNRRISQSEARLRQEVEQRRRTEELLATHRDTLERRVAERTAELAKANESLRRSESTLRHLHEITAASRVSLETQIEQLLVEGCRYFRLDRGALVAIGPNGELTQLHYVGPEGGHGADWTSQLSRLSLDRLQDGVTVVALPDLGGNPTADHHGALLATGIIGEGTQSAFLMFSDPAPRERDFSDVDIDILLLMAGWLGNAREKREISRRSEEHQQQLAHVTRLGAMGEMAAGIAHELNQPLTAIVNYANGCSRLIQRDPGATGEISEAVGRIAGDALRAAETIRRLREFLRQGETMKESISLTTCVDVALSMVADRLSRLGIEIVREEPPHPLTVEADRIQVEQVIINLLLNAMDALQNTPREMRRIVVTIHDENDVYRIDVQDNGPGMTPAEQEKIFHPFFTTKPEGMGMGLSISRTIAEAHGGTLRMDMTGSGMTRVSLSLPASVQPGHSLQSSVA